MNSPHQLLIAGGGIGGLATALAAARQGWGVRLFERAPEFSEVGAGIQLGPNVTRILRDWKLEEELGTVVSVPSKLVVRNAVSGAEVGSLELGARCMERYGAPYVTIHRADLHRLLCRAVYNEAEVVLRLGQTVKSFNDHGSAVTLTTQAGQHVEGDALVGADGVWSGVRQQLLDDGPPSVTGHLAYRTMLSQDALTPSLRTTQVTVWLGPRLHIVQYPVRQDQWMNVVAIVHGLPPEHPDDWDHSANAADLARATGALCSPLRTLLDAVPSATINSYPWRLWALAGRSPVASAEQMVCGNVALLGDAAHPMRPYLAQGAGMAIEDAAELGRSLAMDMVDVPTRLQRYAMARWQRVGRVQARSMRNGQIFHSTGLMRVGRDASIRLLGERVLDVPWLYGG
ncbi:FAD-dependent monooxygenase [Ottowia sp.]|uniref:FAD-dependent monooxygenase n=1 Tax=Ottowia sp. TaxID=1898956 RepID=UPI003A889E17